jgi:hypothetical protein
VLHRLTARQPEVGRDDRAQLLKGANGPAEVLGCGRRREQGESLLARDTAVLGRRGPEPGLIVMVGQEGGPLIAFALQQFGNRLVERAALAGQECGDDGLAGQGVAEGEAVDAGLNE